MQHSSSIYTSAEFTGSRPFSALTVRFLRTLIYTFLFLRMCSLLRVLGKQGCVPSRSVPAHSRPSLSVNGWTPLLPLGGLAQSLQGTDLRAAKWLPHRTLQGELMGHLSCFRFLHFPDLCRQLPDYILLSLGKEAGTHRIQRCSSVT